ncbi:MAG: ROK family protein [Paracoccus sp. (in: a-proteobacteria)]|nr:ROK family protein [Paracoccus sp. (in: a-proteobacteria)]
MILCFDIGGSTIKIAHAWAPDDVRPQGRVPTPGHDLAAFLAVLRAAIAAAPEPPARLTFSIAGDVDGKAGVAKIANIPCLDGRPVVAEFSGALGLPVDLANDADCFALAEATVGAGRGHDIVLGIILGTGIGGGIVLRGELVPGMAGEWGHGGVAQRVVGTPEIVLPEFPCGCGATGCLDAVCGARGLERLHRHLGGQPLDTHAIITGWQAGAAAESRTISIWLQIMTGPLVMMQNTLGAGVIAAGGGLSNSHALLAALDGAVRARLLRPGHRPLIVPAECRVEPGLVGAAILGLKRLGEDAGSVPAG